MRRRGGEWRAEPIPRLPASDSLISPLHSLQ
jgi:hypothetical protein